MTEQELVKLQEISEVSADDVIECKNCQWQGPVKDLVVTLCVLAYPRVLACPNCGEGLIYNLGNAW